MTFVIDFVGLVTRFHPHFALQNSAVFHEDNRSDVFHHPLVVIL